jgi:hypothetical protein
MASVYSQNVAPDEMLIIDNSRKGCGYVPKGCRVIKTGFTSRSKARNIGVKASKENLLVFLDGDTLLGSPFALEELKKYYDKFSHGYGAKRMWTYPQRYFEKNKEEYLSRLLTRDFEWITEHSFWPKRLDKVIGFEGLQGYSFPGNFGFISRKLFDKIKGFDERFEGYGGEDDHFAYKAHMTDKKGFKSLFNITVVHIDHPKKETDNLESIKNGKLFQGILKSGGVESFNIHFLFGIPNFKGEGVIEWQK